MQFYSLPYIIYVTDVIQLRVCKQIIPDKIDNYKQFKLISIFYDPQFHFQHKQNSFYFGGLILILFFIILKEDGNFFLFQIDHILFFKNSYIKNSCQAINMQTTCPKCQQRYSTQNPPKKLINCDHVICLSCLSNEILCPIDRKRLERRRYTIEAFQTHQQILKMAVGVSEQQNTPKNETAEPLIDPPPIQQDKKACQTCKHHPEWLNQQAQIENKPSIEQTWQQPEKNPAKDEEGAYPRYQDINFETCLLHSKTADLICLKDKCLICSNCGLFGEHRNHDMLPYDTFVNNFTTLIEQSYNNFQLLKKSQQLLDRQTIEQEIDRVIKQKRETQVKNVKKVIAGIVQALKNSEKAVIAQLDACLKRKKQKLMKGMTLQSLQTKVHDYYSEIQKLSQGSVDIFRLQNIENYIDYVNQDNSKNYINKQGEYLIAEIETYSKNLRKKFNDDVNQIQCRTNSQLSEIMSNYFELSSQQTKSLSKSKNIEEKQPKMIEQKPLGVDRRGNQEDLLITSCEIEQKKKENIRSMSPIQPIPKFQQTFDTTFKNSYKENIITGAGQEFFLRVKEVQSTSNHLFIPQHKKTISFGNKTLNNTSGLKQVQLRKEVDVLNQNKAANGRQNSNNSSHIVQRQILSVLNQNKKKKKLQLPQKYTKVYDQLYKDKLDVLDFGGAYLGDQVVLSISELFDSRVKLKSVKLMNNKISDEIFPQLLSRCRNFYSINLSYNNLTEKSLEWLEKQAEHLGSLSNITISNNKIVLRNVKDRIQNLRRKGVKVSL